MTNVTTSFIVWYGLRGALQRLAFERDYRESLALIGAGATFMHGSANRPLLAMFTDDNIRQMWIAVLALYFAMALGAPERFTLPFDRSRMLPDQFR